MIGSLRLQQAQEVDTQEMVAKGKLWMPKGVLLRLTIFLMNFLKGLNQRASNLSDVAEIKQDVVCRHCGSKNLRKLIENEPEICLDCSTVVAFTDDKARVGIVRNPINIHAMGNTICSRTPRTE